MIRVDIWGGDLHQNLIQTHDLTDWDEVLDLVKEAVETGLLVNVMHLDFRAPPSRVAEQNQALRRYLV